MLLWIEGFDNFGTTVGAVPSPTGVVARKYSVVAAETYMDVDTGRLGGYSLQLETDTTCYVSPGNLTTNATVTLGFAAKWKTSWPWPSAQQFAALYDGTTQGMNLYVTTVGEVSVRRGTTVLATTSGLGLSLGAWAYFEFQVTCAASGSYELRVNGVNVLSASGVNTKAGSNNYHTTFRLTGTGGIDSFAVVFDDLYFLDASGSLNTTFLGNMRVTTIRPDGDDADNKQWTPGTGSDHSALVDEAVAGTEANEEGSNLDYVQDTVSGHLDLYTYAALAGVTSGIAGVQINTDCRNTDTTSYSLKTPVKSGATESDDTAQVIGSTNYVTKHRVVETDPDTAPLVAWTADGINAALFGIKVG